MSRFEEIPFTAPPRMLAARADDAAPISSLHAERWRAHDRAEHDASTIGFVCIPVDHPPELGAWIDDRPMAVSAHGQELGRRLQHGAGRAIAAASTSRSAHLSVFAANRAARGFLERIGGIVVSREHHHGAEEVSLDVPRSAEASAADLIEGRMVAHRSETDLERGSADPGECRS